MSEIEHLESTVILDEIKRTNDILSDVRKNRAKLTKRKLPSFVLKFNKIHNNKQNI